VSREGFSYIGGRALGSRAHNLIEMGQIYVTE